MFKLFISVLFLSLLTAGCSTKSKELVKFENDRLMHDLYNLKNCRIESAKQLDDGVSEAKTIAIAVIQDCEKDSKYVMDNNMHDKSESYRQQFNTQMNGVNTSGVISIILKQRSGITKKQSKKLHKHSEIINQL